MGKSIETRVKKLETAITKPLLPPAPLIVGSAEEANAAKVEPGQAVLVMPHLADQ